MHNEKNLGKWSSLEHTVKSTKNSVVRIDCKDANGADFIGTGFIVRVNEMRRKAYICTNKHIVRDLKSNRPKWYFKIKILDRYEADGKVLFESEKQDLAIIKINLDDKKLLGIKLKALEFTENSNNLRVKDPITFIGNNQGELKSGIGEVIGIQKNVSSGNLLHQADVVIIKPSLIPGYSGGPVFNSQNKLIAMTSYRLYDKYTKFVHQDYNTYLVPSNDIQSEIWYQIESDY